MIRFECDYSEGAHPKILEQLIATNMVQTIGYSEDRYCTKAKTLIRNACGNKNIDIHFLVGGTQTNTTVITSILRPHQGVICASTGHINIHESGAIENRGHKVLSLPSDDGKITAQQINDYVTGHWNDDTHEHMVQPAMVYISFPTENGTLYSLKELQEISSTCKKHNLPLYLDGARLGYGLVAPNNDVSLNNLTKYCDIFYIGGTKVGCLMGEAVVICNKKFKTDFRYIIKQQGGLLAKGRLLGIQFSELFTNDLYYTISRHAIKMALIIRDAFAEHGVKFLFDSTTNQQYPILSNEQFDYLKEKYAFAYWCKVDNNSTAVRFCTSWATDEKNVQILVKDIQAMPK